MGVSRSATIVCAFLIHDRQWSVDKAMDYLRTVRPVQPNDGFISQLQEYSQSQALRVYRATLFRLFSKSLPTNPNRGRIVHLTLLYVGDGIFSRQQLAYYDTIFT